MFSTWSYNSKFAKVETKSSKGYSDFWSIIFDADMYWKVLALNLGKAIKVTWHLNKLAFLYYLFNLVPIIQTKQQIKEVTKCQKLKLYKKFRIHLCYYYYTL